MAESVGGHGGIFPQLEALPHLPPSEEKNGQNQPFWAELHFAPSMPPPPNSGAATDGIEILVSQAVKDQNSQNIVLIHNSRTAYFNAVFDILGQIETY